MRLFVENPNNLAAPGATITLLVQYSSWDIRYSLNLKSKFGDVEMRRKSFDDFRKNGPQVRWFDGLIWKCWGVQSWNLFCKAVERSLWKEIDANNSMVKEVYLGSLQSWTKLLSKLPFEVLSLVNKQAIIFETPLPRLNVFFFFRFMKISSQLTLLKSVLQKERGYGGEGGRSNYGRIKKEIWGKMCCFLLSVSWFLKEFCSCVY